MKNNIKSLSSKGFIISKFIMVLSKFAIVACMLFGVVTANGVPVKSGSDALSTDSVGTASLPADTLTGGSLGEVSVEAAMQRFTPTASVYNPTSREKKSAQDLISLLNMMSIPQLVVNPMDKTVTDNFGKTVAIYINYLPATAEDQKTVNMANVRRVEVMDYPTDPRFRGAEHVVNIIVREYEYGGYTKVMPYLSVIHGITESLDLYSKFVYGKMTYDLFVSQTYGTSHHAGKDQNERFLLSDGNGGMKDVYRSQRVDDATSSYGRYPITFRATYNTDKVQLRNIVGFNRSRQYKSDSSGSLFLSETPEKDYRYFRTGEDTSDGIGYQGNYTFMFANDYALSVSSLINYAHSSYTSNYNTTAGEALTQYSTENAYECRLEAYVSKTFAGKHTVMLGANSMGLFNRVNSVYSTGDFRDKNDQWFASARLQYNFSAAKAAGGAAFYYVWHRNKINGKTYDDHYPVAALFGQWVPSNKHSVNFQFQYATGSPEAGDKIPDLIQRNEYLYRIGNPDLENCRHISAKLFYNWSPSNVFRVSAFGSWYQLFDQMTFVPRLMPDQRGIVMTYVNSGDFRQAELGASFNLRLLQGALSLSARPAVSFYKSTGINSITYNPFNLNASAFYYLGDFYFGLQYFKGRLAYDSETGCKQKQYDNLSISAGWSKGNWQLGLGAYNLTHPKGCKGFSYFYDSKLYSDHTTGFTRTGSTTLVLTATYTISYGKKVLQGDEVGAQQGASSAIAR